MLTLSSTKKTPNHRLNNLKMEMVADAYEKYGIGITPIKRCGSWENSFTCYNGRLLFWFNTPDNSTHAVKREIDN